MKEAVYFIKNLKIETYTEWKLYVSCHYNNVIYYNVYGEECPPLPDYVPPNIKKELQKYYTKYKTPITIPDPNFVKYRNPRRKAKKNKPLKRVRPPKPKQIKINQDTIFSKEPEINLHDYLSYEDARIHLKKYNITCYHDWLQLVMNARIPNNTLICKPDNIPDNPNLVYLIDDSWCSWGHFFNIPEREVCLKKYHLFKDAYLSYEAAKEFTHTLKLSGYWDWKLYTDCPKTKKYYNKAGNVCPRKPITIPVDVKKHYMKTGDWVSWPDFLGYIEKESWTLDALQKIAFDNNIKTMSAWYKFARQNNYPIVLNCMFYNEWHSWKVFLGIEKYSYLDYYEAKKFLSTKNLSTIQQYTEWWDAEKPKFLPKNLDYYRNFCKNNDIEFRSQDFLSSGIVEKFNNMEDISVVYISCYNNQYINNLISVSVDKQGLVNASLVMNKKNQRLLGMFNLRENTELLKEMIKKHCVRYSQGENNQYLVTNYYDFMNEMQNVFEEVILPSLIT